MRIIDSHFYYFKIVKNLICDGAFWVPFSSKRAEFLIIPYFEDFVKWKFCTNILNLFPVFLCNILLDVLKEWWYTYIIKGKEGKKMLVDGVLVGRSLEEAIELVKACGYKPYVDEAGDEDEPVVISTSAYYSIDHFEFVSYDGKTVEESYWVEWED